MRNGARTRARLTGSLFLAKTGDQNQGGRRGSSLGRKTCISWRRKGANKSWLQWLPHLAWRPSSHPSRSAWGSAEDSSPVLETSSPPIPEQGRQFCAHKADMERMTPILRVLSLICSLGLDQGVVDREAGNVIQGQERACAKFQR